jgi:hypothetical protein
MELEYCHPPIGIAEWAAREPSWGEALPTHKRAARQFEEALGRIRPADLNPQSLADKFKELADEWSRETGHISSASDLINNTRYQQIISLGWPVIPYLLNDLKRNKRFWFPALAEITGLRPFDPRDASNYRHMTDAWLRWGRRKGLI